MTLQRILFLTAVCVLVFGMHGCTEQLTDPVPRNPIDPRNPNTAVTEPPVPRGLTAVISDRRVELYWTVSDPTGIAEYKIYRWEVWDEVPQYFLLDTSEVIPYSDSAVANGQEYSYKVSAVNTAGLEGTISSPISATPNLFGIAVDNGNPRTALRDVTLTLSASDETVMMAVSNSSVFGSSDWRAYQVSISWQLEAGDGAKTVYAKFRDSLDSESETVSDEIVLDTQAFIESVTESTAGAPMGVGDVIHFSLDADEAGGVAEVSVEDVSTGLVLYDDGTSGDAVAGNGVYERDYTVTAGVEVVGAYVIGYFTDDLGNSAEPLAADGTVTILVPPGAITLYDPIALSEKQLMLSWSRNTDTDFDSYRLYRSDEPGVATSDERVLVAALYDPAQTDYLDWGLEENSTYYYAVYAVDTLAQSTISNEVSGTTLANDPPDPVELYTPWAPDTTSLEISWAASEEEDFMYYELFGWEQDPPNPPNSADKRLVTRTMTPDETFYLHESLLDTLVYWYHVVVVDSFGERAVSDDVWGSPRPRPPNE